MLDHTDGFFDCKISECDNLTKIMCERPYWKTENLYDYDHYPTPLKNVRFDLLDKSKFANLQEVTYDEGDKKFCWKRGKPSVYFFGLRTHVAGNQTLTTIETLLTQKEESEVLP